MCISISTFLGGSPETWPLCSVTADKHHSFLSKPVSLYIGWLPCPPSACIWGMRDPSVSWLRGYGYKASGSQPSRSHQGTRCPGPCRPAHPKLRKLFPLPLPLLSSKSWGGGKNPPSFALLKFCYTATDRAKVNTDFAKGKPKKHIVMYELIS